MKRIISCLFIVAVAITIAISCKKDDNGQDIAPPRDYAVQYATEKEDIEDYLDSHYIEVDADGNVTIDSTDASHPDPIRNDPRLTHKMVTFAGQEYKVYYLVINEGTGDKPTRGDNILAAYDGRLLNGTQFDYMPYPQSLLSLGQTILGWQEILPFFREGVYDTSADPNGPPQFNGYGVGVMFLPSALAYYNNASTNAPAYSSMVFSFKLYRVEDSDLDGDGLLNKQELNGTDDDPAKFDSDGDGIANYLDTDDDNDGVPTIEEVLDDDDVLLNPIPTCTNGGLPRHLDPACY